MPQIGCGNLERAVEACLSPRCPSGRGLHRFHGLVGGEDGVGEVGVVDEGGLVAVAPFGMLGRGGGVLDDGDFEALLD